jgi:probable phosphoglycerate mutase
MTTCYVVRHADKEPGDGFYDAHLRHQDSPISAAGRARAERLAASLADRSVCALYVSEYRRTQETAAPAASRFGLTPVVDARLNEFDNGLLEPLTEEQVRQTYPEVWQGFQDRAYDFRFPGGETGAEAAGRIAAFLEEVRIKHADGGVLIVCHEGLIRLMMCHIMELPVYRRGNFHVDFCGLTEIRYQPEYRCWKLIRFNQSAG